MPGYTYTPRVLDTWSETAQDHNYYEAMQNAEHNAAIWRGKYERLLERVQAHECEGQEIQE